MDLRRDKTRPIKIASRASKLALIQSNYVRKLLQSLYPGIEISIVKISTKGDRDKSDFLYKSGSVGLFTSAVEKSLLDGRSDLAVHSLKDLPTAITPGLVVAAIPKRENICDALVTLSKSVSIKDLSEGATVGTSSLRRIAQLRHIRSDLKCVPLRGNVETRVRKVAAGEVDAIIVACAGLNRLGLSDKISAVLPSEEFVPAPAQGALAIQIRADDNQLADLVSQLDDNHSRITAQAERRVLAVLHGGCSIPLGVCSRIKGDSITIDAVLCNIEGERYIKRSKTGRVDEAQICAEMVAHEILAGGGQDVLNHIRTIDY